MLADKPYNTKRFHAQFCVLLLLESATIGFVCPNRTFKRFMLFGPPLMTTSLLEVETDVLER